jgi:hypothetical protein
MLRAGHVWVQHGQCTTNIRENVWMTEPRVHPHAARLICLESSRQRPRPPTPTPLTLSRCTENWPPKPYPNQVNEEPVNGLAFVGSSLARRESKTPEERQRASSAESTSVLRLPVWRRAAWANSFDAVPPPRELIVTRCERATPRTQIPSPKTPKISGSRCAESRIQLCRSHDHGGQSA